MKPKKQPEKWEKRFDNLDYLFHGIDNGKFCWGDKRPIFQEDTGGKRIVGYKTGQCFCGGEKKKKKIKSFISQVRQEAIRETLDKVEKAIKDLYEMRKVKRIVTKEAYGGFPPIFYEELTFTDLWWDRFIKKIDKMKKQAVDDLTNLKNKLKEEE